MGLLLCATSFSPAAAATEPIESLAPTRVRIAPVFIGTAKAGGAVELSGNGQFVLFDRADGRVGLFDRGMNNTLILGEVGSVAHAVSDRGETVAYSSGGVPFRWSRETGQSLMLPTNGGLITDMALSQSGAVAAYTERTSGTTGILHTWTSTRSRIFSATVSSTSNPGVRDVFTSPNGQSVLFRSGSSIRSVAVSTGSASFSPLTTLAGLNADASVQVLPATAPVRFTVGLTDGSTPTAVQYPSPSIADRSPVAFSGNAVSVIFWSKDELYRWKSTGELAYLQPSATATVGRPRDVSLNGRVLLTTRGSGDTVLELVDLTGAEIPIVDRLTLQGPQISDQIRRLYLAYLERDADAGGIAYWGRLRASGTSLAAISAEFASSTEFAQTYGVLSESEFVDLVYNNVLGRVPDAEGRAFWIERLAAGATRGEMMIGFSESQEFLNRTLTVAPGNLMANRIERLYRAYFDRGADQAGLDYWIEQFTFGSDLGVLSGQFVGSTEFVQTYGSLDNEQFVDLVYQNVLGRAPDAAGRAFWLEGLAAGGTRGGMMIGFSESLEFKIATDTF